MWNSTKHLLLPCVCVHVSLMFMWKSALRERSGLVRKLMMYFMQLYFSLPALLNLEICMHIVTYTFQMYSRDCNGPAPAVDLLYAGCVWRRLVHTVRLWVAIALICFSLTTSRDYSILLEQSSRKLKLWHNLLKFFRTWMVCFRPHGTQKLCNFLFIFF